MTEPTAPVVDVAFGLNRAAEQPGPLELVTLKTRAHVHVLGDDARRDPRVDVRIEAGEIPPRPAGEGYAAWYDEHVGCTTPGHRYLIRERGERFCAACLGR